MHRARRVRDSADFIRVELLPPVKRSGYIDGDEDLTEEFPVVGTRHGEPVAELLIRGPDREAFVLFKVRIDVFSIFIIFPPPDRLSSTILS